MSYKLVDKELGFLNISRHQESIRVNISTVAPHDTFEHARDHLAERSDAVLLSLFGKTPWDLGIHRLL